MNDISYMNNTNSYLFSYHKYSGYITMKENHFHDSFEIYYLLSGKRTYFIKDNIYTIRKGDLVLINRYDLHRTIDAGVPSHERYVVNFKPEFFMPCDESKFNSIISLYKKGISVISLSIKEQSVFEEIFKQMYNETLNKLSDFDEINLSYLIQLLIYAKRYIDLNPLSIYQDSNPVHEKVSLMVQYINEHYREPLSVFSVSGHFYISPYYFCKIFKKYTGYTFTEYLNNLRIIEAQKLLREAKLNILEVSERVGFGSTSHFGRIFKRICGVSPHNYKKTKKLLLNE